MARHIVHYGEKVDLHIWYKNCLQRLNIRDMFHHKGHIFSKCHLCNIHLGM
jgi:hypothetical protein